MPNPTLLRCPKCRDIIFISLKKIEILKYILQQNKKGYCPNIREVHFALKMVYKEVYRHTTDLEAEKLILVKKYPNPKSKPNRLFLTLEGKKCLKEN